MADIFQALPKSRIVLACHLTLFWLLWKVWWQGASRRASLPLLLMKCLWPWMLRSITLIHVAIDLKDVRVSPLKTRFQAVTCLVVAMALWGSSFVALKVAFAEKSRPCG